jgi:salicylate hydroxylase
MPPNGHLSGRPVLVVGAGVAGLAAGLALAGHGAAVEVLEQAPAITEVGAGLQVSPNGARVLRALGIDPSDAFDRAQAVVLHDARGRPVVRMDLPTDGPGFWLAHRADLIAVLEGEARGSSCGSCSA